MIKKNPQPVSRLRTSLSQERNLVVSRPAAKQKKVLLAENGEKDVIVLDHFREGGRHCPLPTFLLSMAYTKAMDSCQGVTCHQTYVTVRRYDISVDGAPGGVSPA
jgi:hypothetical protein